LELLVAGKFVTADIRDDELLVLPGSLLTLLTGGVVPPLYHRVRNNRQIKIRQSLLYFVNPSLGVTEESVVHDPTSVKERVQNIWCLYQQSALIEEFIDGREISVGIIGNGTALRMPRPD
jgi:hypothetical protein